MALTLATRAQSWAVVTERVSLPLAVQLSWLLQAKSGLPARLSKPVVSHLFHPVRPICGIDAAFTAANDVLMFGDEARGAHVRALQYTAGASSAECQTLAEAAASMALAEVSADDAASAACVVPRSTACLFVRGRNDPVIEPQYVDAFYAYLKARSTSSVEWHLFEKAQHAMAVVEAPEQYKGQHVERLLRQVPEWAGAEGAGPNGGERAMEESAAAVQGAADVASARVAAL